MEVLEKSANHAEFVLKGQRHTFPNLLKNALLKDSSVDFVSYRLEHPLGKDARFAVKTKGKTAKKALTDAGKRIDSDLDEFRKAVSKALK